VAITSTPVFETNDLDVCQDVTVEIHPAAWEAISLAVSTVVVKKKVSDSSRGECVSYGFPFPNSLTRVLIMSRRRRRRNCGPAAPAYGPQIFSYS
jgi:hypothetical protein